MSHRLSTAAVLLLGSMTWLGVWRPVAGHAQPPAGSTTGPSTPQQPTGEGGPDVLDSSVGYIDNAIPADLFRLRFDSVYRNRRPTRAEFFYPRGGITGPGLPRPESNVDYQELIGFAEMRLSSRLSAFVEAPIRFINPDINDNSAGFGDLVTGMKFAFWQECDTVASFQLKTYVPTGDADRGLGTDHVSLEPGLLLFHRLSDKVNLEAELRDWISVGGSDFAGNLLRYGVGVSYGQRSRDSFWLTPVIEFVGWTALDGKEVVLHPAGPEIKDATGDTIVNAKAGLRLGYNQLGDIYTGYGRALTGETWYKDIWRIELRIYY